MPLTGGEIRLDRSHDGRVANLTLSHGRYNIITWETRQVMADRFAEIDARPGRAGRRDPGRGRALHLRRRHRRLHGGRPGRPDRPRPERDRGRPQPQAGHRRDRRLLLRRRPRAGAVLRHPDRHRPVAVRPARDEARHDPRQRRHPATGPADRPVPGEVPHPHRRADHRPAGPRLGSHLAQLRRRR